MVNDKKISKFFICFLILSFSLNPASLAIATPKEGLSPNKIVPSEIFGYEEELGFNDDEDFVDCDVAYQIMSVVKDILAIYGLVGMGSHFFNWAIRTASDIAKNNGILDNVIEDTIGGNSHPIDRHYPGNDQWHMEGLLTEVIISVIVQYSLTGNLMVQKENRSPSIRAWRVDHFEARNIFSSNVCSASVSEYSVCRPEELEDKLIDKVSPCVENYTYTVTDDERGEEER